MRKREWRRVGTLTALALVMATPVGAGFEVRDRAPVSGDTPTDTQSANVAPTAGTTSASGTQGGGVPDASRTSVFAQGLPLQLALEQVVPRDYEIEIADGVDPDRQVSFSGAGAWPHLTRKIAARADYTAGIEARIVRVRDGDDEAAAGTRQAAADAMPIPLEKPGADTSPRKVDGDTQAETDPVPGREPEERTQAVDEQSQAEGDRDDSASPESARDESETVAAAESRGAVEPEVPSEGETWSVRAGETLRTALERWRFEAGWQLRYDSAYSYPVEAAAVFEGDFIEAAQQFIEAYGRVEPGIQARFYTGNRVLVIRNSNDAIVE